MYRRFYPLELKPTGWLRRQLEIQAKGLSGNLDLVWPDIRDSAWIGGTCEGWERVPYWLDGFIPLAFLLDDQDLIGRAQKYISAIVARQQEDGWICPCKTEERSRYDIWALFLIGKVLALYCEFTQDASAEMALYRAMKNGHELLAKNEIRLFSWGKFRWFEAFIPLLYLYERQPEEWMLDFARELKKQGADYPSFSETWKRPLNQWTLHTHIVNLGMMLKYEAVTSALLGEKYKNETEKLWRILNRYNGTAVGVFTGDECLSGLRNNQGTELCSVNELMYSCEWLYQETEDGKWADRLEKASFNALPATFTDDMWAHQYDQQVNQVSCKKFPGKSFFRTNNAEAHLFGLEPNYGCCTANLSQAWPKLAMNAYLRAANGIHCALFLPAILQTKLDDIPVSVETITEYPFRLGGKIRVTCEKPVSFELSIRVPGWTKAVKINGEEAVPSCGVIAIKNTWQGTKEIIVEFVDRPVLQNRPHGLKTLVYGPLVFALPIQTEYKMLEYERNGVERKFPYCDYELIPHSDWNYGFAGDEFEIVEKPVGEIPFSSIAPPVMIRAQMAKVKWNWAEGYENVPEFKPVSNVAITENEEMLLHPYGCAKLRMTEMPLTRKRK